MSWHFSQALVEAYSGANFSGGELSAPSKSTTTPGVSSCNVSPMESSIRSRSGTMCEPSTGYNGADVLTWFLAGFPVRTSLGQTPPLKASTGSEADYGGVWRELFVKWNASTSSWKIHQCLWEEDLLESSVILPRWGMMRGGELWEGQASEPPHFENAYGLWPTPCAAGGETGGPVGLGGGTAARMKLLELCETEEEARALGCGKTNPAFAEWLLAWPINWTSIEPNDSGQSAMDKYQEWLRWHGKF